jgi:hypothetical protein
MVVARWLDEAQYNHLPMRHVVAVIPLVSRHVILVLVTVSVGVCDEKPDVPLSLTCRLQPRIATCGEKNLVKMNTCGGHRPLIFIIINSSVMLKF